MKGDRERFRVACCGTWHHISVAPGGPFILEDHRDRAGLDAEMAMAALDWDSAATCVRCLLWWQSLHANHEGDEGPIIGLGHEIPVKRLVTLHNWASERRWERIGLQRGQRRALYSWTSRVDRTKDRLSRAVERWLPRVGRRHGFLKRQGYHILSVIAAREVELGYEIYGVKGSAHFQDTVSLSISVDTVRYLLLRRLLHIGAADYGHTLLLGLVERLGPSEALVDCATDVSWPLDGPPTLVTERALIRRIRGNAWARG